MVDILWAIAAVLFLVSVVLGVVAEEVYGGYRKQEDFLMGWALTLIISAFIVGGTAMYITKGEQDNEHTRSIQEVGDIQLQTTCEPIWSSCAPSGSESTGDAFYPYGGRASDFVYSLPKAGT